MNLHRRRIDPKVDRELLLELHCLGNYESETPWGRNVPYESYRKYWMATSQTESFLNSLEHSLGDARTLGEIWKTDDGTPVAYLWITCKDVQGYDVVIAEVNDIAVAPEFQRRGIGRQLLEAAESHAGAHGASLLRSETGIDNLASQELHNGAGFKTYQIRYEKTLIPPVKS